ncbi:amidohydrolase family protein [Amycolatopsis mediterranei]|uniref:amidohydrolase family protein n=2 Tax=Amycolatopsis mediterranei TaxID=33910 RepID=UPI001E5E66C4|nr:amidohydrolase family protein [Amycolatopsis mediterranei]UZF73169.1 amidohydrolase family protein [Amycolatopsis mediterranei]
MARLGSGGDLPQRHLRRGKVLAEGVEEPGEETLARQWRERFVGQAQVVGATVVDGSGRDPVDVDVSIEDGHITQVGASGARGERLDAGGLTMTPGLIDAHVHLGLSSPIQPQFSFRLSAAELAADIFATADATLDAGFTTVRDTGGVDGGLVTTIAKGKVRGPRVLSCGPVQ